MRTVKLSDIDARIAQNTRAFALERLTDREFLEWARLLRSDQVAERAALRDLLDFRIKDLGEPYASAWQYLFEFWDAPFAETSYDRLLLKRDLKSRASQSETISLIVSSVRPWIRLESARKYEAFGHKRARHPKTIGDIFWISMEGGEPPTPDEIDLKNNEDRDFLFELALALNASLLSGLNQARRIGMIAGDADATTWLVHRVYFVPPNQYPEGGGEPDRYKKGFAPTTKLLFATVEQLARIDQKAALRAISSWDVDRWKLYKRLWAAAAREASLISASDVAEFLVKLDDREFWWTDAFPEFAELRALRWSSLPDLVRTRLERRLIKGEPPGRLIKRLGKDEALEAVTRRSAIELQRIKIAGGQLSDVADNWLHNALSAQAAQVPITGVTQGFNVGVRTVLEDTVSDPTFDDIPSSRLIEELARQLSDEGWDSKSRAASDYIGRNPDLILDLLSDATYTAARAKVWQALGYSFRPVDINATRQKATPEDMSLVPTALKMCAVIATTEMKILDAALPGLTSWMSTWDRLLNGEDGYISAWLTLWPMAVVQTNNAPKIDTPLRDRSFSTPVGNLVDGFIRAIPNFKSGTLAREPWSNVLVALADATGEAALQARYQLMRFFDYFWSTDRDWVKRHLLAPLLDAKASSIELWQAFAETEYLPAREVLEAVGPRMIEVAAGSELPADIRGALAQRSIFATIIDMRDDHPPTIPSDLIQQMLRIGGDDVRARALRAMKKYLKEPGGTPQPPAERFSLIKELFENVWPKELTLSSPALSDALADFPAAAGQCFADAADLVLPYLTPFQCWSLWEYGILDRSENGNTIGGIHTPRDAVALLAILDKTVGSEEGAVIPNGLDRALRHISERNSRLENDVRYQRLLTLSRR
jgi:hypothetical protein